MASPTEGRTQAFRTRSGVTGVMKTGVATAVKVKAAATYPLAVAIDAGSAALGTLISEFTKKPTQENDTMRAIQALHAWKQSNPMEGHFRELKERKRGLEETMVVLRKQKLEARMWTAEKEREYNGKEPRGDLEDIGSLVGLVEDDTHLAEDSIGVTEDLKSVPQLEEQHIERKTQDEYIERDQREKETDPNDTGLERYLSTVEQTTEGEGEEAITALPPNWVLSEDEINAAKIRVQYDPRNFHFAIAGQAGSGKSSLINAFLNLAVGDPGAATVGVTETTEHICRFKDRGTAPPRPWTVWYDIPGAGTLRIPHEQYFKHQALYVFDVIILTIGDRFEKSDCQIIEDCDQFGIPCIVVRSKSDMHIDNMVKDKLEAFDGQCEKDKSRLLEECRNDYRERSRKTVTDELRRAGIAPRDILCVSKAALRKTYNSTLTNGTVPDGLLDEVELVNQLMLAATNRRHPHEIPAALIEVSRYHTPGKVMNNLDTAAGGLVQQPIIMVSQQTQQATPPTECRRVLRLPTLARKPTVDEISRELDTNNTSITSMLVKDPEVRSKNVVVLTFRSGREIPDKINMFGATLLVIMYEDKPQASRDSAAEGQHRRGSKNGERHDHRGHRGRGEPNGRGRQAEWCGRDRRARRSGQNERVENSGTGGGGERAEQGGLGEGTGHVRVPGRQG